MSRSRSAYYLASSPLSSRSSFSNHSVSQLLLGWPLEAERLEKSDKPDNGQLAR